MAGPVLGCPSDQRAASAEARSMDVCCNHEILAITPTLRTTIRMEETEN